MNTNDKRAVKSKNSIRNAFRKLILEKDFSSVSITELATTAGIDRKTFYQHYNSPLDIMKEIEAEFAGKVFALGVGYDFPDILGIYTSIHQIVSEDAELYKYIFTADPYGLIFDRCCTQLMDAIQHSLRFQSDKLSGIDTSKISLYSEYASAGLIAVYSNWLISGSELSLEELAHNAEEIFSYGFSKILLS